jgi:hypothetical protein
MMYFTETGECPEDPIALNDAFEAEYDTKTYEKKISLLMAHAHRRIKRENPEKLRVWNSAFGILSKGDHYLLWRSRCRQLLFDYASLLRQQRRYETRAAGTHRRIYSVLEPAGSTHFAALLPAGVTSRRLSPAFFQTS